MNYGSMLECNLLNFSWLHLISRPYVIYEHYSYHCSQSRETPWAFDALLYDHEKEIGYQGDPNLYFDGI